MKERIIEFLRSLSKYDSGLYMRLLFRLKNQQRQYRDNPDDKKYIESKYEEITGRRLNLDNPQRFSEKLQWMKLYYRDPIYTTCADKYAVREYIRSKGYGDLLNELLQYCTSADEFDADKLPDRFVVKASHSSAMNFICQDKNKVNWKSKKRIFDLWLRISLYKDGREWAYKNITPGFVVEKYLEDDSGYLRDYKFFCMDGRTAFIQVDEDRYAGHKRSYYSTDWEKLEFSTAYADSTVKRPDNLEKMLEIASDLSRGFPFVRVDLYNCNGKIYFGELTFYPESGFLSFNPDEYDFKCGELIKLPEKKV